MRAVSSTGDLLAALELDEVALSADRCTKCNVCNTVCPVMPATDLFPGPKYCGPQSQRYRLGDPVEEWVDYCSGCGACTRACPSGVKVAELNARARARLYARKGLPLRNRLLSRSERLGQAGVRASRPANATLASATARLIGERLLGIHRAAPLPAFSHQTLRTRFRRVTQPGPTAAAVAYFHGCSTNYYEPWVGEAAIRVLNRGGVAVELPPQNCCGLPFISNGDFRNARRYAEANVRKLLPAVRSGLKIVVTSTSCSYTIKSEYQEVLGLDSAEVREVAAATYDLFEYMSPSLGDGGLEVGAAAFPRRVLYHPPCQLRSHGIGLPALDLLGELDGIEVEESGVACCGIAGTYGLKAEKYEIARRVGAPLVEAAARFQAELVACDSETCRWQIHHLTGLPARHPVEILDEALR